MTPRYICCSLLLLITLLFISCSEEMRRDDLLTVTKVVDGDTFYIAGGSKKREKIRLIGVDAPESRRTGKKQVGYYGKEAKIYLTKLLKGKRVKLEYDVALTDQYGRTLAYVYMEDGTFLNAKLVREGYAVVMTIPPNVKYADTFVTLQQQARESRTGLWGLAYR